MNDIVMPTDLGAWSDVDMAAWRKLARAYPFRSRVRGALFNAVSAVLHPFGLTLWLYRQWPNQPSHQTAKGFEVWRNPGAAVTIRTKKAVAAEFAALHAEMWGDGGTDC